LSCIPMLEPSDPEECREYTKLAFEISEKFKSPVFLRITTRVSHASGIVRLGKISQEKRKGFFVKDVKRYFNLPPRIIKMHEELLEKINKIRKFSEKTKINFVVNDKIKNHVGIVTSGASFNYVMDALDDLGFKLPILKLGLTYPLPAKKIKNFIRKFKSVLVVEELEPILEKEISILAKDANPNLIIFGKDALPRAGELTEELVIRAIAKATGEKSLAARLKAYSEKYRKLKIARRFPLMCPGCPHRASFYAAKQAAGKDAVFAGDIGCYILGIFPPLETQDFLFSMGASEGLIHGIKKATGQKAIAFIGDSTFFHAGIPGLINAVYNKSNPVIIILDNRITAMTGHQPHPGIGITGMGEETKEIKIEDIAKACGVENVRVVDPYNLQEMEDVVKEFINKDSVSVIVAKRECRLLAVRKMRKAGIKIPVFEIDQRKCTKCGKCLYEFACPAIFEENGKFYIDKDLCLGCGVCPQICPAKAIHVMT
ncbi:MAG: thiamine pyrophosphate-dependent enzyme, partial [Candidatus Aenigmarchaeota archaeon]|nr:thiamine pyrophosphate-dependent enzyme [Candidatus Aenigmarchaeota archaeon]